MKGINSPFFCLTGDIDWASEYSIGDFVSLVSSYGVRPTLFATHKSALLEEFRASGAIEVGIHPNFLPGSSHGSDYLSVIESMLKDFPYAQTFRSHCFVDGTLITQEMVKRGVRYDSNLCLYLQPHLVPLRHASGIVRFPVFWEDDVHWLKTNGDWDLEKYLPSFLSPGIKVLNFHPFFVATDIPNQDYYLEIKKHITTLTADTVDSVRYKGEGTRTFLIKVLETLTAHGERFYTLAELYGMLTSDEFVPPRSTGGSGN